MLGNFTFKYRVIFSNDPGQKVLWGLILTLLPFLSAPFGFELKQDAINMPTFAQNFFE